MAVDIEMVGDLRAVDCTCAPQASHAIRASFGAREGGLDLLSSVELNKIRLYFYSESFQSYLPLHDSVNTITVKIIAKFILTKIKMY